MNLIIITTMAAILSIFACLFRTSLFISHFVNEIGDSIRVSVYLKDGVDPQVLSKTFLDYSNVKEVNIITKEEAWEDLKKQLNIYDMNNPLPDTIRIRLKDNSEANKFIQVVKKMEAVEGVQYAEKLVDQIANVGHFINIAAFIVILILGGLTFSIINNTVHLVIESRKQEIEIMRMMGVSNWYIRAPYIFQGIFYGFCGAFLGIIPLFILHSYLIKLANLFYIKIDSIDTNIVILAVLLMGTIVGALGSTFSVKKYLKV